MRSIAIGLLLLLGSCAGLGVKSIHRPWESAEAQQDFFVPLAPEARLLREEYAGSLRVGMSMAEVHRAWGWPHGNCVSRTIQGSHAVILWGYYPQSIMLPGPRIVFQCYTTGRTLTFDELGLLTGWQE